MVSKPTRFLTWSLKKNSDVYEGNNSGQLYFITRQLKDWQSDWNKLLLITICMTRKTTNPAIKKETTLKNLKTQKYELTLIYEPITNEI